MFTRNPTRQFRDGIRFQRNPLPFLEELVSDGEVSFFKAGFSVFCLVRSPSAIKRVLVTENTRFGEGKWTLRGKYVMRDCMITREGPPHRERRKLLQPAFGGSTVEESISHSIRLSLEACEKWKAGETIDLFPALNQIALGVVGHSLFGFDFHNNAREINDALGVLLRAIPRPPIPWPRVVAARKTMQKLTSGMSEGPLIELMAQAGMSKAQIHDEIVSLLIASVDTTPKTIAWALALIGKDPSVDETLQSELRQVLGDRIPSSDDLTMLPYLNQVIQETLRLYPPVHFIDRRTNEDIEFGETLVPAGTFLLVSPLLTHRDPKFYDSPSEFCTDRWSPEAVQQRDPFTFFPFGAGPHACIGKKIASVEMALVIATITQRWQIRPSNDLLGNLSPNRADFPVHLVRRS